MSRFRLPTQKGTELFPTTIQQPVNVQFEGIERGSDAARKMMAKLEGDISSFYARQGQAYSLSVNALQAGEGLTRGNTVKMQYQNTHGVEHIFVRVPDALKAEALTTEEKVEKKPDRIPDFCVVDFIVEGTVAVSARFRAEGVSPSNVAGVVVTDDSDGPPPEVLPANTVILYARNDPVTAGEIAITKCVSSLKIDLRRISATAEVEIDVYGGVHPYDYPPTGEYMPSTDITKDYEVPPTLLDDQTTSGHTDGSVLTDYLGNAIPNFLDSGPVIEALYNSLLATLLDPGGYTHTTFIPDGDAGHYGTATYIQVIEDPIYSSVLHRRRLSMTQLTTIVTGPTARTWHITWEEAIQTYDLVLDPVLAGSYATVCSVAGAFYWNGQDNKRFSTLHPDGAGIWSPAAAAPTRSLVTSGVVINDRDYFTIQKIGRIKLTRGAASVKFVPA